MEFRTVGLAVAPDVSLFLSDWVRRDYTLHNKGALWQVRWKGHARGPRPADAREGLLSMHRPLREAAARALATDPNSRDLLRESLRHPEARVRASALRALIDEND